MNSINDYLGKKLGFLTVVGLDPTYEGKTYNSNHWLFACECGNVISRAPSRVISGHTKSCGCKKRKSAYVHGMYNSVFYHTWWSMMQRCYNKNHHNYARYGMRGISVCAEWHDVSAFVAWAESTNPHHISGMTLERKNFNGNYCPENCTWASAKEQANNRRNNALYTFDGQTKTLSEWCNVYNIDPSVVIQRIKTLGWDHRSAFVTPVNTQSKKFRIVEIDGESRSVSAWCRLFGISTSLVYSRIKRGMDIVEAITRPKKE